MDTRLKEALQCAEYALVHPGSDQYFALNAVREALAAPETPQPGLSEEQVREALAKSCFPHDSYTVARLARELNALLGAAPLAAPEQLLTDALKVSEEKWAKDGLIAPPANATLEKLLDKLMVTNLDAALPALEEHFAGDERLINLFWKFKQELDELRKKSAAPPATGAIGELVVTIRDDIRNGRPVSALVHLDQLEAVIQASAPASVEGGAK